MALYRVPGTWQSHSCRSPHITDKKPEILRGEKGKTEQNPTRKPASSDPLWGGFPSAPSLGQPTEAGKQPGETQTASSFPLSHYSHSQGHLGGYPWENPLVLLLLQKVLLFPFGPQLGRGSRLGRNLPGAGGAARAQALPARGYRGPPPPPSKAARPLVMLETELSGR